MRALSILEGDVPKVTDGQILAIPAN